MSTHRFIPAKRKGKRLPLLFMLGGLLLLIPLLWPATALAAPRSARSTASSPTLTTPQIVDLAGVSVVRLSLTYFTTKNHRQVICTELGTIVASWPQANPTDKNTWVLTDGSLLSTSKINSCTPGGGSLTSIEILASNEFTNEQPAAASLDTLSCSSSGVCTDTLNNVPVSETILAPINGAVLFSFRLSGAVPYVPVEAPTATGSSASTAIALVDRTQNNALPTTVQTASSPPLTQFLTPIAPSLSNATSPGSAASTPTPTRTSTASGTPTLEAGTPSIDGNGKLTSAQLSNGKTVASADIQTLENQIPLSSATTLTQQLQSNTVNQHWDTGIIQYEQGNYQGAITTLSSIRNQNPPPAFKAPAAFIQQAQAKLPKSRQPGNTPAPRRESIAPLLIIIGLVAGVLALILFFLLVSIRLGRNRVERKRELESFKLDEQRARERVNAEQEARRKVAEEQLPSRRTPDQHVVPALLQPVVAAPSPRNIVQPRPQQPPPAPKLQDDPAIQAALQRLWDRAGR